MPASRSGFFRELDAMKNALIIIAAVLVVAFGVSFAQAQCSSCGGGYAPYYASYAAPTYYASYYAGPSCDCSSCDCSSADCSPGVCSSADCSPGVCSSGGCSSGGCSSGGCSSGGCSQRLWSCGYSGCSTAYYVPVYASNYAPCYSCGYGGYGGYGGWSGYYAGWGGKHETVNVSPGSRSTEGRRVGTGRECPSWVRRNGQLVFQRVLITEAVGDSPCAACGLSSPRQFTDPGHFVQDASTVPAIFMAHATVADCAEARHGPWGSLRWPAPDRARIRYT